MDPGRGARLRLLSRCLGAIPHALWIRGEEWNVETVWQDVRFALRTLAKRPAFTLVAVGTLALGIGANTAVFSVVDAVVLRPLPMPTADRLLWMWGRTLEGRPIASVSPPDFLDYREETDRVFEEFAAYSSFSRRVVYTGGERPEELLGRSSTANYLAALGLEPVLGRTFTAEEEGGSSTDPIMISHGLWERLYAGARDVVGRTLRLDGEAHTIVGVLPEELGLQDAVDVWSPLTFADEDYQSRGAHFLRPIALLRAGVTRAQAQEALDAVSARLEQDHPETNDGWYPLLEPVQSVLLGTTRPALLILMGAVALVLLIACANVGSLLIARSAERRGELAVRTALGASRGRITRQLLVESLILAVVAAALGLLVAAGGIAALERLAPAGLPRMDEVAMNGRVLLVTLAVSLAVGIAFGTMPAAGGGGGGLAAGVASIGRGRSARRAGRLRAALVTGEVALSFVLLVGAALLMRSFVALRSVDPGFDARGVLTMPLSISEQDVGSTSEVVGLLDRIQERVAALPGVARVAVANLLPMTGSGGDTYVYAEGRPPEQIRNVENTAEFRIASEDFFDALGIEVRRGRGFTPADAEGTEPVVVVNQRLADRLFPGEDPLGRGLVIWLDTLTTHRIVGVVEDVHQYAPGLAPREEFYLSERQSGARGVTLVVKGREAVPSAAGDTPSRLGGRSAPAALARDRHGGLPGRSPRTRALPDAPARGLRVARGAPRGRRPLRRSGPGGGRASLGDRRTRRARCRARGRGADDGASGDGAHGRGPRGRRAGRPGRVATPRRAPLRRRAPGPAGVRAHADPARRGGVPGELDPRAQGCPARPGRVPARGVRRRRYLRSSSTAVIVTRFPSRSTTTFTTSPGFLSRSAYV